MNNADLLKRYDSLDLKKLPGQLKCNGFDYYLIERVPEKCIYHQCEGKMHSSYEVFQTRIVEARKNAKRLCERYGQQFDESKYQEYKEVFPKNEEFGKRAWTYPTLEMAKACYDGLTEDL